MIIHLTCASRTSDRATIKSYLSKLRLPKPDSHKGQNGKLLIVGGSSLFHAASLWSAEVASRFVDMVHYSSTEENNQIFINLKTKFVNGMVVRKKDLPTYAEEDDCILVGPGMMRSADTYNLVKHLITHFPHKKFVFDAGALQMMDKKWLAAIQQKPILTPHAGEFERLFDHAIVKEAAHAYHAVILLKTVDDIISNGTDVITIKGGNAGLTKGGTGDVLAGLTAAFYTCNNPFDSAAAASLLVKTAADDLLKRVGFWYNTSDLIHQIPATMHALTF